MYLRYKHTEQKIIIFYNLIKNILGFLAINHKFIYCIKKYLVKILKRCQKKTLFYKKIVLLEKKS